MNRRPLPAIPPSLLGWHLQMGGVHNKVQQQELLANTNLWREEQGSWGQPHQTVICHGKWSWGEASPPASPPVDRHRATMSRCVCVCICIVWSGGCYLNIKLPISLPLLVWLQFYATCLKKATHTQTLNFHQNDAAEVSGSIATLTVSLVIHLNCYSF